MIRKLKNERWVGTADDATSDLVLIRDLADTTQAMSTDES